MIAFLAPHLIGGVAYLAPSQPPAIVALPPDPVLTGAATMRRIAPKPIQMLRMQGFSQ